MSCSGLIARFVAKAELEQTGGDAQEKKKRKVRISLVTCFFLFF